MLSNDYGHLAGSLLRDVMAISDGVKGMKGERLSRDRVLCSLIWSIDYTN